MIDEVLPEIQSEEIADRSFHTGPVIALPIDAQHKFLQVIAALRRNGEPDMRDDSRTIGLEDFVCLPRFDAPTVVIPACPVVAGLLQGTVVLNARIRGQHRRIRRLSPRGWRLRRRTPGAESSQAPEVAKESPPLWIYVLYFISVWHLAILLKSKCATDAESFSSKGHCSSIVESVRCRTGAPERRYQTLAALAAIGGVAMLSACVQAQTSAVSIALNARGLSSLRYQGKEYLGHGDFRLNAATFQASTGPAPGSTAGCPRWTRLNASSRARIRGGLSSARTQSRATD